MQEDVWVEWMKGEVESVGVVLKERGQQQMQRLLGQKSKVNVGCATSLVIPEQNVR